MGRLKNLLNKIPQKRIGFQISETMSGTHEFEPGHGPPGKHHMEFTAEWGPENISEWINPSNDNFLSQDMHGHVNVEHLCTNAPFSGTLELRYFTQAKINYSFDFKTNESEYHFEGSKRNIKPWNVLKTHRILYGEITDTNTGKLISTSVLYFEWSTLPSTLASIRFK